MWRVQFKVSIHSPAHIRTETLAYTALTTVPPVMRTCPESTHSNSSSKAPARCHRPDMRTNRHTHPPRSSRPQGVITRHCFPYVSAVMFPSSDGIEPVKLHDDSVSDLRLPIPSHSSRHTKTHPHPNSHTSSAPSRNHLPKAYPPT